MKPISLDTAPEAQRVLFDLLRKTPASKKLELTFGLTQALRELVFAEVRRQFPQASEEVLRRKLISRLLPREAVMLAYNFDPNLPLSDQYD